MMFPALMIYCVLHDEEVYGMLSSLDVSKASGPDGVSARMLTMTAEFIAPSVCKLFNISLQTV